MTATKRGLSRGPLAILFFATILHPSAANALTIVPTYDSSVTSLSNFAQIQSAVNYVVAEFGSYYSDPITVNITITATSDPNVFGMSNFGLVGQSYTQIHTELMNAKTTNADNVAFASLPTSAPSPTTNNGFWLNRAQAKALAVVSATDPSSDGTFTFGTTNTFTYDPNNRAVPGEFDFIGVTEHEFSEILGRSPLLGTILKGVTNPAYDTYDLFRYTTAGRSLNPSDTGVYFSLDSGATNLRNYNSDPSQDVQDWADGQGADAANAVIFSGLRNPFTSVDVTTLDVIGYHAVTALGNFTSPVGGNNVVINQSTTTTLTLEAAPPTYVNLTTEGSGSTTLRQTASTRYPLYVTGNLQASNTSTLSFGETTGNPIDVITANVSLTDSATLRIQSGSTLTSTTGSIGNANVATPATVVISGSGSNWTDSGNLNVGDSGKGSLFLLNGGTLTTAGSFIGANAGAVGTANVSGSNSSWTTSGAMSINATGTLNINGGTVQVGGFSTASATAATINLNGGTFRTPPWSAVSTTALNFNGGTLQAAAGLGSANFLSSVPNNRVLIYAGGATIDTNGNNITITQNLTSAANNGVSSVSILTPDTLTVFSSPPAVTFSGSGGAAGYATLDANGHIASIVVTNAGSYSTPPVAQVAGSTAVLLAATAANSAGGLTKTGSGQLTLTAAPLYGGNTVVNGGNLRFNVNNGTPVVGSGATVTISSTAVLEMAGTRSALASGTSRANIINNAVIPGGLLVSGVNQQVGNISGSGTTQVDAGSNLTANHIIQSSLIILGSSTAHGLVTIDASDSSGNPLASGLSESALTASDLAQQTFAGGDLTATESGVIRGDSALDVAASGSMGTAGSVPEPSSGILLAVGGLAMIRLISRLRKNRRRSSPLRRLTPGL